MGHEDVPRLVHRAQAGDLDAYGELVELLRDAVFGLCYHRCANFETARDLAQDTFLRAYLRLSQCADPEHFPGWLRRIAERVCIDWRRRQRQETPLENATRQPGPPEEELAVLRVTVERALSALPEMQRLAVTLFYIDGYTYREIAEFLVTSETTVKARLDAAREKLRGALTDAFRDALQAQRPSDRFREEVMMRVTQIQLKEETDESYGAGPPYLLLGDGESVLPLRIGAFEGTALRSALSGEKPARPMTYDLMLDSLAAFGIRVTGVRIAGSRDSTILAELELTAGTSVKHIDCRPSDAVNLALRADAPVEIADAVLGQAAMSAKEAQVRYGGLPEYPAQQEKGGEYRMR